MSRAAADPSASASIALPASERRLQVVESGQRIGLRELWEYRDLLFFLTWRDLKVRYTQALLGLSWAVAQPLLLMLIFTLFLDRVATIPIPEGVPYALFVLTGLLPWTYFANATQAASDSLVGNAAMVGKVYFPRLVVPLAAIGAWLPDLVISLGILAVMMAVFGVVPGPQIVLLPAFLVLSVVCAASLGLWLSALNVAYRDVKYVVPFMLQAWLFVTPVVYPADALPASVQVAYGINPMVAVVEGFRWAVLGAAPPNWGMIATSLAALALVLGTGLAYFRRVERYFADVI